MAVRHGHGMTMKKIGIEVADMRTYKTFAWMNTIMQKINNKICHKLKVSNIIKEITTYRKIWNG